MVHRAVRIACVLVLPGAGTPATGISPAAGQDATATVENLRSLARLAGYVRYFHPSDEAAALDWERFVAHGVERVRDAEGPDALRRELEDLFLPVAPTLRIYGSEEPEPPPAPELTPDDTAGLVVVAWQHLGVGFGNSNTIYRSARSNRVTTLSGGRGNAVLTQSVDVTGLRGRRVRFGGALRAISPGAQVHLWLRVDRPGGMGFFDNMMDRPITATAWTGAKIEGPVAEDAERVVLGAIFTDGEGALDALRLDVGDGETWSPAALTNGSFEEGDGGGPAGWATPGRGQGWEYRLVEGSAAAGERHLVVGPATTTLSGPLFEGHPLPGEVARLPLGQGLVARVPLALHSRDGRTLGRPDPTRLAALREVVDEVDLAARTPEDEVLRVTDVILAWNVFQHFYPYWDVVDTDWDGVLTGALRRALTDRDRADLLRTLRWMVAQLQDGHGYVTNPAFERLLGPPVRVEWIEGEVVVVASDAQDRFRVGDVVVTVDGRPARDLLREKADLFSGTARWRRWRALGEFAWGPPGTPVRMALRREDETVTVSAVRDVRQPPSEARPDPIEELEPGIVYVDLARAPIDDIQARVDDLASARGVVFDLRGYPAGNHQVLTHLSEEPLQSAHWRVPRVTRPDHGGEPSFTESRWNLPPGEPRFGGRIVFLTDGRAISYAESVMGIVEHYRLGEIVGSPTAGANGNVNPFTLPGGYRVTWTGMRVVKHDGSQHHLVGIRPTVPVTRTIAGVREGRDEVLERGLELVRGG